MNNKYEMIVGLEVHIELSTASKIFCSCSTEFGAPPNTLCCPVCAGLPGALPVLNRAVVEYAIRAGLATGCSIAGRTKLDRKNYFYPDLPKAYQISQYDMPLCRDGYIEIETEQGTRRIGIERIHIEEDAGKLIHDREGGTYVDLNRAGVPLIEIVSRPDIRSSEEARLYLKKLRTLMLYSGISDCKMNEGSLRCDVNISVRKRGEQSFGERCEIKNLNSFSFAAKAIDHEFRRQCELLESGERVVRQSRRYNAAAGKTELMRSKESAEDYRYFPEPDLPEIRISEERVEGISREMPRLPDARAAEYTSCYALGAYEAAILTSDIALADYFESAAESCAYPKSLANIIISDLLGRVTGEGFECPIAPQDLAEVANMCGEGFINSSTAKKLITRLLSGESSPRETVLREELGQINDEDILRRHILAVLEADERIARDYKAGRVVAAKSAVGKVMSATAGRANPVMLTSLVEEILKSL